MRRSGEKAAGARGSSDRPRPAGRLLIVEPDELTLWSVITFLEPWFVIETARASTAALRLLRAHGVEALIISDQIQGRAAEALAHVARRRHPNVRIVLLTSDDRDTRLAGQPVRRMEKPFALSDLARLLGVPAGDVLH